MNRIEKFREFLSSRRMAHKATLEWLKQPGYNTPMNRECLKAQLGEVETIAKEFNEMFPEKAEQELPSRGFLIMNGQGDLVPPEELDKETLVKILRAFAERTHKLIVQLKAVVRSLKWGS